MQIRIQILIAIVALALFNPLLNAQGASPENSGQPAKTLESPEELMNQFARKLQVFVDRNKIEPPNEGGAWWETMAAVVILARMASSMLATQVAIIVASDAVSGAAQERAAASALEAAVHVSLLVDMRKNSNERLNARMREILNRISTAARSGTIAAAQKAVAEDVEAKDAGKLIYDRALYLVLKYIVDNTDEIVGQLYNAALKKTSVKTNGPFSSEKNWISFYQQHFGSLPKDQMVFLMPWFLPFLPITWFEWINALEQTRRRVLMTMNPNMAWHSLNQFLPGCLSEHGPPLLRSLPIDLVRYIALLTISPDVGR